ncbi:MAG: hypothetical protein V1720_19390 [bacterium]
MENNLLKCPGCSAELELTEEEKASGTIHCPECEGMIDFSVDPPAIIEDITCVELCTSLNQGDIALIKSILDDSGIYYYTSGENFLSMSPLLESVRFFVDQTQVEDAKELLKDFELNILGASMNHE